MNAKKIMALCMTTAMTISLAACGSDVAQTSTTETVPETTVVSEAVEESQAESSAAEEIGEVSIDFEDGVFAFTGIDKSVNSASDDFVSEVVDFAGSKALQVTPQGKAPYVGIQVDALLGDNASQLKTIEMSIGTTNPNGTFYATSGKIYAFLGENNDRNEEAWSVYLETANPKRVSYTLPDDYTFGAGNYIVVSMETDNGKTEGGSASVLYLDDIAFKDAAGNVLTADTSAEYTAADTGADRSNLCAVTGAVEFPDFAVSGDGWAQNGLAMPQEIIDALVPGAVIEITYSSENGDMWIVMPESAAGWMRVGDGNNGSAYVNGSKNIAQITYEQIVEWCGDDVSTWGTMMQCEASGAWEVFSVKVGQQAPNYTLSGAVEFPDFAVSGDGWAQNGLAMPQEIIDALVPGSLVEITYSSENGDMWIVMPESAAGWMRVGDGNNGSAISDGSVAYIPYEMIVEWCGEDVSTWGSTMQCEASGAWEVYSVRVGMANEFKMINNLVEFPDFTVSGDGWAQNGLAMPQEIIDALVPGSVITISYSSENNDMWIVMPESAAGWMRVGDGNNGTAACNGKTCQITYEQIVEWCGDDVSTWGSTMQCEASGAWEVYSVAVGMSAE